MASRWWTAAAPGRHTASAPRFSRRSMAGAALAFLLLSLLVPAVARAGASSAPPAPPAAAPFVAAPAALTQAMLTSVSPGAIDVLLGAKPAALSPTPAAAEAPHDLADSPDLGSVPTAAVDPASVLASGFVRPVEGPITSRFGPRFHPILHVWKLHTGTDIGAACGTPVKAAKDGTVGSAGVAGGYGNRVVIDHGDGLATTYNHLTSYAATVGMQVRQGQIIGYVGTTGLSTGCHLHFEVMVKGVLVDSGPYLDLAPAPSVTIPPAVGATSGVAAPVAAAAAPAVAQAPAVQAPAVQSPPGQAPAPPPASGPAPPAPPPSTPSSPTTPTPPTPTTPTTSCPPPDGTPPPASGPAVSCTPSAGTSSSAALKSTKSTSTPDGAPGSSSSHARSSSTAPTTPVAPSSTTASSTTSVPE